MKKQLLFISALVLGSLGWGQRKPIKVACVGNSITYGYGIENREQNSYPSVLQRLLGKGYKVENFGHSGATLLSKGHRPYIQQEEYQKALAFAGDIVVIHLGINDTDPRNWPNHRNDFVKDYLTLISSFKKANPKAHIVIARMSPLSHRHPRFESGTRDWHAEIQQAIALVAQQTNAQLIDFHEPLYHFPQMLPDAVHPNAQGAAILAQVVYGAITGDYGGLQLPEIYSDNMVLQHGQSLPLHGIANAGTKITVTIGNQQLNTTADSNGKWQVTLAPLAAKETYTLQITAGKEKRVFKNVVAGEVWLCSGQSNMEFEMFQASTGERDIPQAENPNIRLFDMEARWRTDNANAWELSALDSINQLQYYKPAQWEVCSPKTVRAFSAVAYYFGRRLQKELNMPIGLICNAVGGSPTEAWIDRRTLEYDFPRILNNWRENDFIMDWVRQRAGENIAKATDKLQRHPYEPAYLFEAGILPLAQYPIKGVIWYQGESNAHNKEAHSKLFPLLVKSWRTEFGNSQLPFYYVQLSSINRPSWGWFRESQRRLMKVVPHSGMAVSYDYGHPTDVHPKNKQPIGERLAQWALGDTYGKKVLPSGPLFRSATFNGKAATVAFDYAQGMHSADGKTLRGFELSNGNGIFYPATAEVIGEEVKVTSEEVSNPKAVRYGFSPVTDGNLVNEANLPASTFTSEP
ncbi:GDSL-type esterase/lipase family protein [Capnocytophaga genosp. AHN8471]|uniref:GDSL-type esterase/lipase family protein n=1 Tax=Capnocytophaga genosp. AHN8471 TaxID=327574 RepID=UPI0019346C29|nr:GDSL-type esterase/lipase family protein [Capnocytophaga genosp. AHN8471]MBM0660059.1 sialate O-acetylesterase [Capnocytophaga genosp. AHN8471]